MGRGVLGRQLAENVEALGKDHWVVLLGHRVQDRVDAVLAGRHGINIINRKQGHL